MINKIQLAAGVGIFGLGMILSDKLGRIVALAGGEVLVHAFASGQRQCRLAKQKAEADLDQTIEDSFPASDPPAYAAQR